MGIPAKGKGEAKKGTGETPPPDGSDDGGWPSQALAGVAGVVAAVKEG